MNNDIDLMNALNEEDGEMGLEGWRERWRARRNLVKKQRAQRQLERAKRHVRLMGRSRLGRAQLERLIRQGPRNAAQRAMLEHMGQTAEGRAWLAAVRAKYGPQAREPQASVEQRIRRDQVVHRALDRFARPPIPASAPTFAAPPPFAPPPPPTDPLAVVLQQDEQRALWGMDGMGAVTPAARRTVRPVSPRPAVLPQGRVLDTTKQAAGMIEQGVPDEAVLEYIMKQTQNAVQARSILTRAKRMAQRMPADQAPRPGAEKPAVSEAGEEIEGAAAAEGENGKAGKGERKEWLRTGLIIAAILVAGMIKK